MSFGESVFKSLLKHKNYSYHDFVFNKQINKGFINIKIKDEPFKTYPKIVFFDLNENKANKIEFLDLKKDYFVSIKIV